MLKHLLVASLMVSLCGRGMGEATFSADAYFAPENQLTFKLVGADGFCQEFERDYTSPDGGLRNGFGWTARFLDNGKVSVKSPAGDPKRLKLVFDRGRLVSMRVGETSSEYPYEQPRTTPENVYPPLAVTRADNEVAARDYAWRSFVHKWDGSGRLQFPFVNPNQCGALYAELFLLFLFGTFFFRRPGIRIACGLVAAASSVCLVWTMSRGAWLGCLLGVVPVFVLKFKAIFRRRLFWCFVLVLFAALGLWMLLYGHGQITRGLDGAGGNWTNAIRLEILGNAPRMMHDAPEGWSFCGAGTAYLHWYQPLSVFALTPTLINDHLTRLVDYGWLGRGLYLTGWILLFAVCSIHMIRTRIFLPLGLWTVLFVAACFNPISHVWTLWVLPVLSLAIVAVRFPWRDRRLVLAVLTGGIVFGTLLAGALWLKGSADAAKHLPICADGRRVSLKGIHPQIWIVDDGTLGGGLTGKDLREFYEAVPHAPAIGFVSDIGDLPQDVPMLVLSGPAGYDWLMRLSEDESARRYLPKKVVFVSPSFSPSDIPPALFEACSVKIVVGEFAANFNPDYKTARPWVRIVPGMEKYILRWIEHVLGE